MMKRGAPPDKFGVLYRLLDIEFYGFTSRINSKGYHSLVPGLISIFLETVWVPLIVMLGLNSAPQRLIYFENLAVKSACC